MIQYGKLRHERLEIIGCFSTGSNKSDAEQNTWSKSIQFCSSLGIGQKKLCQGIRLFLDITVCYALKRRRNQMVPSHTSSDLYSAKHYYT